MDTVLFEDLTRKEDQSRLNRCTDLFASLRADNVQSRLSDILTYLHDTWSVIRSECGKQLSKKAALFSDSFITILLSTCKNSTQWQEIHGSILGLSALLSVADNSNQPIIDDISELCLSLIGHVNIPVKESARSCLINIQKQRHDKSILLHKIVALVSTVAQSTHSDSEVSALQLDGLLGCLADTYQLFPELVLPSEHLTEGDSALEVVKTIRICALHPASTVRQKAGQIITLFMLTFLRLPLLHVPAVVRYITSMLTQALRSRDADVWCLQEISLMVSEELVRVVVEIQLEVLGTSNSAGGASGNTSNTNNTRAAPSAMLTHTYSFLNFLKNHLSTLLGHTQFEVRRMTIQLLPLLARAYVLLNASFGALTSVEDVDFLSQEEVLLMQVDMRIVFDSGSGEDGDVGDASNKGCGVGNGSSGVEGGPMVDSGEMDIANRMNSTSVDASDIDCDDININRLSTCSDISDTHNTIHDALYDTTNNNNIHSTSVLNSSFRSVYSTHTAHTMHSLHSHHSHPIDIQHITQMVWLSELIKENQHIFEAYALSDAWASSSVTSTLQMRSHSIKDSELHRQLADFAIRTSTTSSISTIANNTAPASTANTSIYNMNTTPSHYTATGAISKLVSGKHSFRTTTTGASTGTNTTNATTNSATNDVYGSTTNTAEFTRGVVDHWSLDVRGRLTEIEKRTQFHRTVRALVNTEIESESSRVCCLLLQNCKSVLAMCESMVYAWESAVHSSEVNFMSTLHTTLHTVNSTHSTPAHNTNNSCTTLSIDLIECFALIDSFLLSVMLRFTHCPDIQSVLCNLSNECDPEVELLQSAAQLLRERLCTLYPVVVRYIARVQCIGRGSVHVGARSGVSGNSTRVTASQELLGVYSMRSGGSASGSGVKGGLFADAMEGDGYDTNGVSSGGISGKNNSNTELSDRAIVDLLLSYVHTKMSRADGKDTATTTSITTQSNLHSIISMQDIVRDMHADNVFLVSSLTNTTVSLGSHGTHVHTSTTTTNATATADVLHSPAKQVTSQRNTPLTRHLHTPHSHSPTRYSTHAAHTTKYLSMDQWNCEAVSPLLTCLAHATSEPLSALQFSAIVVEWCVACVMNPLWLDSRHNAKKNLFEALVLLLSAAELGECTSGDSVYILVVFRIVRAVTELLSLRSAKPLLELKLLMCSIKAAISAIRLCMRFQRTVHGVFASCDAAQGWVEVCSVEIAPLVAECAARMEQSWQYYSDIYPLPSPHAHTTHMSHATHTHAEHAEDTTNTTSDTPDDASETSTSSSDEFSDWDEESDISVPEAPSTADFNASGNHVNTLLPLLYEDVEVLQGLLVEWAAV